MEFLNGLKALLLELLAGRVCQQAGGCSLHKRLLECAFSPLLAESKLLRQEVQERHWPVSFIFFCVGGVFREYAGAFKKAFWSGDRTLPPE